MMRNYKQKKKKKRQEMSNRVWETDSYTDGVVGEAAEEQLSLPLQMVNFVCVLALLSILFVWLILEDLHPLPSTRLILTGLRYRVQLTHLVLKTPHKQTIIITP